MPDCTTAPRFTLRQLPLPAKLVVTLFMLTVGLGYSSAMVQMHFQHTQGDGTPMPGSDDLIAIFAGKKKLSREEIEKNRPVSKLEKLVTGPIDGPLAGTGSMGSAFYKNDKSDSDNRYKDAIKKAPVEEVNAQREGERALFALWINAPEETRQKAYEENRFVPPQGKAPAKMSPEYVHKDGPGFLIKQLIGDRCVTCHQDGGLGKFPLEKYEQLAKYAECAPAIALSPGQEWAWCASERQISKEKLAQSTHAHLLSFAMLFTLTGFVFSFTSYSFFLRCFLAPLVLLAQVSDVICWWLARLDGPGIYFAQAILATGAVVGIGLTTQIVLSVFNMYGPKGKIVLVLLFLAAGGAGFVVMEQVVIPQLNEQKAKKAQQEADAKKPAAAKQAAKAELKAPIPPNQNGKTDPMPPMPMMSPTLDRLLTGKWENAPWGPDKIAMKVPDGGMVRAFFDKDTDFKDVLKEKNTKPAAFKQIVEERESEQSVVLAWVRAKSEERKKAYDEDKFPLPAEMKGKPMTAEFMANDKAVKIRSIFESRCSTCHGGGTKVELDSYEALEKFLK
jgi:hypothetical protein